MTDAPVTPEQLDAAKASYDAEARRGVVATPRYRLAYVDWGRPDDPPVVFVHGLSDQARSFCMVLHALVRDGFRCVGYELADGLRDGATLGRYKHPHYVADLLALLDALKLQQVDLMGASFGSTVTLRALSESPSRFRRGVLQGGFARRPLIPAELALARVARYLPGRMGDLPGRKRAMAKLDAPQFPDGPAAAYAFLLECAGRTPIRAAALRALTLHALDLRPLLPTVRQPLLLIGGDRDTIVPRNWEAEVEAGVPHARRVEFARCGHYPQYMRPAAFAAAVAAFLRPG